MSSDVPYWRPPTPRGQYGRSVGYLWSRSPFLDNFRVADDPLRMAGHFTGLGVIRQLDAKGDDILGLSAWGKYPLVWFCWRSLLTCRVTVFLSREESSYRSSQDYDFPTRP